MKKLKRYQLYDLNNSQGQNALSVVVWFKLRFTTLRQRGIKSIYHCPPTSQSLESYICILKASMWKTTNKRIDFFF